MIWRAQEPLGIYVSVPFCRSKCTYCNFASGVYPASDHGRYVERVIAELAGARQFAEARGAELPRRVDTIYLGGGTPSLLEPDLLRALFAAIRSRFVVDGDAGITMECAPGQIADATLVAMCGCGVNRVSLGVQSFIDAEAGASGRLHSRADVLRDLARLRSAGIANISIDLIAGLAGQSLASWAESLSVLIDADVPHASIYMLEIDEDSRLGRELLSGGVRYRAGLVPNEDAVARFYEVGMERLGEAGLMQYEISNFARAGFESRHNVRYWQRRPYLGVGLDASSMLRCGTDVIRWTTTDDLRGYLEGAASAPEVQRLGLDRQLEEAWFLGLRLNEGVGVAAMEAEFGAERVADALATARRLSADGLLEIAGDQVRLTPRGRLLSNDVFAEFLADTEAACSIEATPEEHWAANII